NVNFNVFSRVTIGDKRFRMIPSQSMEIAFLKTRYQRPFLPNPVQGPSTVEDIALNEKKSLRDLAVPNAPFPLGGESLPDLTRDPLPSEADNFPCLLSLDFIFHDFYHCYYCSEVAKFTTYPSHTDLWLNLAEQLKKAYAIDEPKNWLAKAVY